jgi:hypothetical protein
LIEQYGFASRVGTALQRPPISGPDTRDDRSRPANLTVLQAE